VEGRGGDGEGKGEGRIREKRGIWGGSVVESKNP